MELVRVFAELFEFFIIIKNRAVYCRGSTILFLSSFSSQYYFLVDVNEVGNSSTTDSLRHLFSIIQGF